MIHAADLRDCAIIPALGRLAEYDPRMMSDAAINLLLGTAAHESLGGRYLRQIKGPALGPWQIEPDTEQDIWDNYAVYRPELKTVLVEHLGYRDGELALATDLVYSAMIARLVYWRSPMPMPDKDDRMGLAAMYKIAFNTVAGKASVDGFLDNYAQVQDAVL